MNAGVPQSEQTKTAEEYRELIKEMKSRERPKKMWVASIVVVCLVIGVSGIWAAGTAASHMAKSMNAHFEKREAERLTERKKWVNENYGEKYRNRHKITKVGGSLESAGEDYCHLTLQLRNDGRIRFNLVTATVKSTDVAGITDNDSALVTDWAPGEIREFVFLLKARGDKISYTYDLKSRRYFWNGKEGYFFTL